jgi:uncharacterized membrane protein YraQ (UPF0718 family)
MKYEDILHMFLSLVLEGAPYILLGAVISGLIDSFLPSKAMDRFLPSNKYAAVFVAGLMGAVFPVCECAIVPVIRRLVAKGLPISCAMTYMLSAPIINPIVALSTWSAFQVGDGSLDPNRPWIMMGSRLAMGYMIAVIIGLVMTRFTAKQILHPHIMDQVNDGARAAAAAAEAPPVPKSTNDDGRKLVQAMRTAQKDFVDVGMYFVIGVLIASIFKTQVVFRPGMQEQLMTIGKDPWLAPLILMALAFVLSLCSTTDAFVIAADSLFSKSAKLAFLVFGPMMDMKLIFLYSTILQRRVVIILVFALALLTWLMTLGWGQVLDLPVPIKP